MGKARDLANLLADSVVGTSEIANNAITPAKMANGGLELGVKNRIINGDMRIDQRNAGASVTSAANSTYFLDRWRSIQNVNSKFSVQRNAGAVTPPAGFQNYFGSTSLSAYSVSSADTAGFGQAIEGYNVSDLAWGTANAQSVTLSFRVYSSLTGTFAGSVQNNAQDRSYPFTFSVASANTWTTITVTIAGDTSGTWLTTNGAGLWLWFSLGSGSNWHAAAGAWSAGEKYGVSGQVNVIGTNGATFYITGVQLEAGSVATPFERRPYGTELALCQRYCTALGNGRRYQGNFTVNVGGNAVNNFWVNFPTPMRAAPTLGGTYSIAGSFGINSASLYTDGMDFLVLRSGFAWETAGLLQTGDFVFSAEL